MAKVFTWIGVGTLLAVAAWRLPATAQTGVGRFGADGGALGAPGAGLITHFQASEARATALTIVDPQVKVVAVYHINRETGEIQLKSVRPIRWDLALEDFNTGSPLPAEIRKGLEGRQ